MPKLEPLDMDKYEIVDEPQSNQDWDGEGNDITAARDKVLNEDTQRNAILDALQRLFLDGIADGGTGGSMDDDVASAYVKIEKFYSTQNREDKNVDQDKELDAALDDFANFKVWESQQDWEELYDREANIANSRNIAKQRLIAWRDAHIKQATSKVDRFEVIDETGRAYVRGSIYGSPVTVELSYQDDGKTLKVFVKQQLDKGE